MSHAALRNEFQVRHPTHAHHFRAAVYYALERMDPDDRKALDRYLAHQERDTKDEATAGRRGGAYRLHKALVAFRLFTDLYVSEQRHSDSAMDENELCLVLEEHMETVDPKHVELLRQFLRRTDGALTFDQLVAELGIDSAEAPRLYARTLRVLKRAADFHRS